MHHPTPNQATDQAVLEVAILEVIPEQTQAFEQAFILAEPLIARANGYLGHQLQRCLEQPNRYILLVRWQTLSDHTSGFRQGSDYPQWKALLHHFYRPFPKVEHYQPVLFG